MGDQVHADMGGFSGTTSAVEAETESDPSPARVSGNFDRFNFVNATSGAVVGPVDCTLFDAFGNPCPPPIHAPAVGPGAVFSDSTVYPFDVVKIECIAMVNGAPRNFSIDLATPPIIARATFGVTEDDLGTIQPFGVLQLGVGVWVALQAANFV